MERLNCLHFLVTLIQDSFRGVLKILAYSCCHGSLSFLGYPQGERHVWGVARARWQVLWCADGTVQNELWHRRGSWDNAREWWKQMLITCVWYSASCFSTPNNFPSPFLLSSFLPASFPPSPLSATSDQILRLPKAGLCRGEQRVLRTGA